MSGLYIHIPWCVKKCPYCDFNSHEKDSRFDENRYVARLIEDFEEEVQRCAQPISTVYFGGGTPSLFAPQSFAEILARPELTDVTEVTMEANPGAVEHHDFAEYRAAGINRLSLGIQSFNDNQLPLLGRIHDANEARAACIRALEAGFSSVNLDLMYGLPEQSIDDSLQDLQTAIALQPQHISWYELTLEPNTVFGKHPPKIPPLEVRIEMSTQGIEMLGESGYQRYEVSAYARDHQMCAHNYNYWTFGNYIGIGAGAHGKILRDERFLRTRKPKMPNSYLNGVVGTETVIDCGELPVEFMMNVLRLTEGVPDASFTDQTRLPLSRIEPQLRRLRSWGLMELNRIQLTPLGYSQLDSVVAQFLAH
ncbi:MAG: radical SAM family heme chaperone HemW [Gammaproteobacteria bacterium]|nr:radical SAM family heme chaperone HemW [Gammaproteobacteria bacterium]MYC24353.1 radical SAM family heme chaperone HemW [Gammaproteobacteria bacterium]